MADGMSSQLGTPGIIAVKVGRPRQAAYAVSKFIHL